MEDTPTRQSNEYDELLALLADRDRRRVVHHFLDRSADVVSVEEVAADVAADGTTTERTRVLLHHAALPRLDAAGVLEYDDRSGTVRYHGDEELERLLRAIPRDASPDA